MRSRIRRLTASPAGRQTNSSTSHAKTIMPSGLAAVLTRRHAGPQSRISCTRRRLIILPQTKRTWNYALNFHNFFTSKISTLQESILSKLSSISLPPPLPDPCFNGTPFNSLHPVTSAEVTKMISSIKAKSSPMDFIPTSVIKLCPAVFSEIISKLANLSFSQGSFSSRFKLAQATSLLKKVGLNRDAPSSYRPISNFNNISKILERLFLSRLQSHISSCQNFNPTQSAYRKHHSTETALLRTTNNVFQSMDHGNSTILVSLDLSAAFDTIHHQTLIDRLYNSFGISDNVLK